MLPAVKISDFSIDLTEPTLLFDRNIRKCHQFFSFQNQNFSADITRTCPRQNDSRYNFFFESFGDIIIKVTHRLDTNSTMPCVGKHARPQFVHASLRAKYVRVTSTLSPTFIVVPPHDHKGHHDNCRYHKSRTQDDRLESGSNYFEHFLHSLMICSC